MKSKSTATASITLYALTAAQLEADVRVFESASREAAERVSGVVDAFSKGAVPVAAVSEAGARAHAVGLKLQLARARLDAVRALATEGAASGEVAA